MTSNFAALVTASRTPSRIIEALNDLGEDSPDLRDCLRVLQPGQPAKSASSDVRLPHPVSVGFYGGDENDKPRTSSCERS